MRKDSPITKAFLGAIVAASLLGLAEVGSRISGIAPAYKPDATGSWQVRANLTNHRMQGTREPHNFSITTNADGLRSAANHTTSDDVFRVALMGDSTVFGWGVADNESVAGFTEESLRIGGFDKIEVINAGQPGYSTGMVGWLFEHTVSLYEPDLTIVFVSMHDFNRTLISDVERHLGPRSLRAHLRSFMVRNVALYELVRRRLYPLAHQPQLLPDVRSKEARVPRVSDEERSIVLNSMATQASQWNGEIAIGFLPFHRDMMVESQGMTIGRPGTDHAKAWATANGTPIFDLRRCCGPGADARTFPFDRGHLNALGNREAGSALAKQLEEHLFSQN